MLVAQCEVPGMLLRRLMIHLRVANDPDSTGEQEIEFEAL
jgi:hypothetical protein